MLLANTRHMTRFKEAFKLSIRRAVQYPEFAALVDGVEERVPQRALLTATN